MEAERDTIDRYVAAWLSHRIGEVFDTRITGVQSFGLFATIMGRAAGGGRRRGRAETVRPLVRAQPGDGFAQGSGAAPALCVSCRCGGPGGRTAPGRGSSGERGCE